MPEGFGPLAAPHGTDPFGAPPGGQGLSGVTGSNSALWKASHKAEIFFGWRSRLLVGEQASRGQPAIGNQKISAVSGHSQMLFERRRWPRAARRVGRPSTHLSQSRHLADRPLADTGHSGRTKGNDDI